MWTKDGLGIAHEEGRLEFERPQAGRAKLGLQVFADRINWLAEDCGIGSWKARRGVIDEHQVTSTAPGEISSVHATSRVGALYMRHAIETASRIGESSLSRMTRPGAPVSSTGREVTRSGV